MRFGIGYDVHRLVSGRNLVLGGVNIPYQKGLAGHSDADVLVHAVMDALLGAAGLGDIGRHFPDNDDQYKDISSLVLLERVTGILGQAGFRVNNVDSVIIAQEPKLAPFMGMMVENITRIMSLAPASFNVKATTTEGLGFAGTGEGIAAYAVAGIKEV